MIDASKRFFEHIMHDCERPRAVACEQDKRAALARPEACDTRARLRRHKAKRSTRSALTASAVCA
eukprot:5104464-Pleurochrysis_carterae.AAC.1